MRITQRKCKENGRRYLKYNYRADRGTYFSFTMLCEVGAAWQEEARAQLADITATGKKVHTYHDFPAPIYSADCLE